ncbi:phage tail tube protein [Methylobacterium segetis]|uniref:phage tail tube protein n=1 Tax=Methylobacterium segetis TaxID=2488750 RepID=UPI00104682F1|nr:phage tail tube protein [Methylobacterium segetis]
MTIASGSGRRIAYVAESVFGTTPATPSFKTFRSTGGGPRTNKTTGTSDEIQPDRNVRDEFMLGQDVMGDYNFELAYGNLDDLLEGALFSTWATNVLKNGNALKSFTIEETLDLQGSNSFSRFTGAVVNTLSLSLGARAKITGAVGIMAQKEMIDTAIVSGATYAAPGTEPISTASANVANLALSGVTPAPKVRSLTLEVNNNLRTRPLVGNLYTDSFGYGMCDVTGTLECYFESNALYAAALAHSGGGALSFTVGNAANKRYSFLVPKLILGNAERRPGGNTDDVMVSIPFRGVYDGTAGCSLQITRGVS